MKKKIISVLIILAIFVGSGIALFAFPDKYAKCDDKKGKELADCIMSHYEGEDLGKVLNRYFKDWYEIVNNRRPCPCTLQDAENDPNFKVANEFSEMIQTWGGAHAGAEDFARSTDSITFRNDQYDTILQLGQQCTYDDDGDFISSGSGAGTPDFVHMDYEWHGHDHFDIDYDSWKDIQDDNNLNKNQVWTIYNKYWGTSKCE